MRHRREHRSICFLIGSLGLGGAERVFTMLASEFSNRGYDVDFVVGTELLPRKEELADGVNRIFFRNTRLRNAFFPFLRYLRDRTPELVLSTLHCWNFLNIVTTDLSGVDTRCLVRVPDNFPNADFSGRRLIDRFIPALARTLYPRANRIICVSDEMKTELKNEIRVPNGNLRSIPNPINPNEVRKKAGESVPDHEFFQSDDPVLLSVGRLEKQKDHRTLLTAFRRFLNGNTGRLLILGTGSKRGELESLVEMENLDPFVDLPGEVQNPYPYFAHCDLFVHSSLWEGMPNVLLEALVFGKTIVATDCKTGPREILENGSHGYLVPTDDPDSLADVMKQALDHPVDPECLKKRADDFKVNTIADQYEKEFHDVLGWD